MRKEVSERATALLYSSLLRIYLRADRVLRFFLGYLRNPRLMEESSSDRKLSREHEEMD
jgi:hypothetical protein